MQKRLVFLILGFFSTLGHAPHNPIELFLGTWIAACYFAFLWLCLCWIGRKLKGIGR